MILIQVIHRYTLKTAAQHTVRSISTKTLDLEQRKVYYRFIQGDGWLMP